MGKGGSQDRARSGPGSASVHGTPARGQGHVLWVLLAGTALTGALFWHMRQTAWEELDADFRALAAERAAIVEQSLRGRLGEVEAVGRLFGSGRGVTREEFHLFAQPAVQSAGPRALMWVSRELRERRAGCEAAVQREGLSGFQFTENDAGGRWVRAGDRAEYYPAYFVEPLAGNEAALGFDMASEPARRAALEQARDSGAATATGPLRSVEAGGEFSLLLFVPVYERGQGVDTVEQRRAQVRGFAAGVFRASDWVEAALRPIRTIGLNLQLLDLEAPAGGQLLYELRPGLASKERIGGTVDAAAGHRLESAVDFRFAGRPYRLVVRASESFLERHLETAYWWVLPLGLMLTGVLSLYLHTLDVQRRRAEALIDRRTAELRWSEDLYRGVVDHCGDLVWRIDLEGRVTFVNAAVRSLTGYTSQECVGQPVSLFVAASSLAQVRTSLQRRRQGGMGIEPYAQEVTFRRKDGLEFITESRSVPILDSEGRVVEIQGLSHDITERKRAEEKLQQLNLALSAIVAASPMPVLVLDAEGRVQTWSPAAERLFGWSESEVLGQFNPTVSPDQAEAFRAHFGRLLQGIPYTAEVRRRTRDGSMLDLLISAAPLRDAAGTITGVLGMFDDITERKRAEEALRASEERLHLVLEGSQLGLWDWDIQAGVVNRNERWAAMLGYTLAEIEPRIDQWRSLIHPDDQDAAWRSIQDHLEGRTPVHEVEIRMRTKDGSYRWILDRARVVRRAADGRPLRMSGTHADITERKRAEEALRQSQADLERAQAVAHVGSWTSDPLVSGRLHWSAETFRIFGVEEATFDGKSETFYQRVHPEDVEAVRAASRAALETGRPYAIEHRILRPDGAIRWVYEKAAVERVGAGKPIRMMGVVQDVTERRHLEEQLRQSQKMQAVGQLAGGVAHDFNNILTAMILQLDLLEDNGSLDTEAREAIRELGTSAHRAAELTRQLLLFGRQSILQLEALDLGSLLADLQKMLRRLLGEQIEFAVTCEPDLPRVHGDAAMIQQVVVNLCVNARDAMPHGGRLDVRAALTEIGIAQVTARPEARPGPYVCLEVADTGCGMNEATRKRLFEPFFTTKDIGKGTGLGLATVHGIVHQHQGWIEVQTEEGRGSAFRVFLPVRSERSPQPPPMPPATGTVGHEQVMLVEDDDAVRKITARFLQRWGYRVLEARDGVEALSLWQDHGCAIDLLFADLIMPGGLSGLELARRLRVEKPGLKVILSSGYSPELTGTEGAALREFSFVPKPSPPAKLAEAIRNCLDGSKPKPGGKAET